MTQAAVNEIAAIRQAITNITKMLSGSGIVVTQRGTNAYVEADRTGKPIRCNLPMIPDNASQDLVDAINGFLDHEVGHLLFTCFESIGRGVAEEKCGKNGLASMHNIIEDVRIEQAMTRKFRGSSYNLDNTRRFFLERFTKPKLAEAQQEGDYEKVFGVLFVAVARAWGAQQIFIDFMQDKWELVEKALAKVDPNIGARLNKLTSTEDALTLSREIWQAIYDNAEQTKQKQKDKQEQQNKDENKQDAGDSEPQQSDEDQQDEPQSGSDDEQDAGGEDSQSGSDEGDADGEQEQEGEPSDADEPNDEPGEGEEASRDGEGGQEDAEPGDKGESQDAGGDEESESSERDGDSSESTQSSGEDGAEEGEEADGGQSGGESDAEQGGDPSGEGEEDESEDDWAEDLTPEELVEALTQMDFDAAMSLAISQDAFAAMQTSEYRVFTHEHDRLGPMDESKATDRAMQTLQDKTLTLVGPLQKQLERLMVARSLSRWQPGQRKGRIHSSNLHRLKVGDTRVFRTKEIRESKDVAVSLLIDCSGSMFDEKIKLAMISAYALVSVLDRLGINCEVLGFTTAQTSHELIDQLDDERRRNQGKDIHYSRVDPINMLVFKAFNEPLAVPQRKRLAVLMDDNNAYGLMGANIDGESVEIAARRLTAQPESGKVMFVLSDGQPACSHGSPHELHHHLSRTVERLEAAKMRVMGIGIMSDAVRYYYKNHAVLNSPAKLPELLMKELKGALLGLN